MLQKTLMNISTPDYTRLFAKFREGNRDAFAFFYEFYVNDLYAYGLSLGGEKNVVKDVIQDVFLKLYFGEKKYSSVDHLKNYLLKSVKNKIYNIYRSKAVLTATEITEEIFTFSITTTILDQIIDDEDRTIIKYQVEELLSKLTDRQKEAIYLRFMQELNYEEIAGIMDITPHAARKLISRSLRRMRDTELLLFISVVTVIFS